MTNDERQKLLDERSREWRGDELPQQAQSPVSSDGGLKSQAEYREPQWARVLGFFANILVFASAGIFFGGIGFIWAYEIARWLLGLDVSTTGGILTAALGGIVGFLIVGIIAGSIAVRIVNAVCRAIAQGLARL